MSYPRSNFTTTDAGIPVESDEHSLTVGPGGPILLQDSYLIEQMAQFNRELARLFSYADAHRHRLGANYQQIPVNAAVCPVRSYSKDGAMRIHPVSDPVYAPNSKGGPAADVERYGRVPSWSADGEIMRTAYVDHAEDDDWGQAGTLVREVLDDAARQRLVDNVVGHLLNGVTEPILERAFEYWRSIDKGVGERVEAGVRAKADEMDPKADEQGNPARRSMQAKA